MNYEDYKAKFTAWAALTEQRLGELCDEFLPPHEEIAKAARYSLLGGGKRIRAVLALAACELSGTAPEKGVGLRLCAGNAALLFAHPRRHALHGQR